MNRLTRIIWTWLLCLVVVVGMLAALAFLVGCTGKAGLVNEIPVKVAAGDIGDHAGADVRKDEPTTQTGGGGWTVNVNVRDGLITIGAVAVLIVVLVVIALKYRTAVIGLVKGVSKLPLPVAGIVAAATKGQMTKSIQTLVKGLAVKNDAYVKPTGGSNGDCKPDAD